MRCHTVEDIMNALS